MLLQLFMKVTFICQVISVPLEPGQQGGPWTSEEINIVKEKVHKYYYLAWNCLLSAMQATLITLAINAKTPFFDQILA